jgi:hypothetical protein
MTAPSGFDWQAELARKLDAQLATFGRQVSFQRAEEDPFEVTAILESGSEAESNALGTYAAMVVRLSGFDPVPDKGDQVAIESSVYNVVEVQARLDGSARLTLHLR